MRPILKKGPSVRINYDKLVRKFEEDPVPFMAAHGAALGTG